MEKTLNKSLDEIALLNRKKILRQKSKFHFSKSKNQNQKRKKPLKKVSNNPFRLLSKKNFIKHKDNRRRLFISNLSKSFQNKDLKDLFIKFGKLKRCGIHFTKLGESKGTADIEFEKHFDAIKAIKKLNKSTINGQTIFVKFNNLINSRIKLKNQIRNNIRKISITKNKNRRIGIKKRVFRNSLGKKRR
jgi:RNA recognition motif-containing protein